jgi:hypothetical protein
MELEISIQTFFLDCNRERAYMSKFKKSETVPAYMREVFENIVGITNSICKKYLNEEYALLARQATAALCRKRSVALSGSYNSWACGIVYALGIINFLFDKTQSPYIKASDLCTVFGLSKSTGQAKAKMVLRLLKMNQFDANWIIPSRLDNHPMIWMISYNGFIVDVRYMPKEVQLAAYQKGLIPKIPEKSTVFEVN